MPLMLPAATLGMQLTMSGSAPTPAMAAVFIGDARVSPRRLVINRALEPSDDRTGGCRSSGGGGLAAALGQRLQVDGFSKRDCTHGPSSHPCSPARSPGSPAAAHADGLNTAADGLNTAASATNPTPLLARTGTTAVPNRPPGLGAVGKEAGDSGVLDMELEESQDGTAAPHSLPGAPPSERRDRASTPPPDPALIITPAAWPASQHPSHPRRDAEADACAPSATAHTTTLARVGSETDDVNTCGPLPPRTVATTGNGRDSFGADVPPQLRKPLETLGEMGCYHVDLCLRLLKQNEGRVLDTFDQYRSLTA
eukprot:COSAG05_NODE_311_length_11636_cov_11.922250_13_plen_311_part_00